MSCNMHSIKNRGSVHRINSLSIFYRSSDVMKNQLLVNKRRFFEIGVITTSCLLFLPPIAHGQLIQSNQKKLWLIRKSTGEEDNFVYWEDGDYLKPGYRTACHLLRDTSENSIFPISPVLLDILYSIQNWLTLAGVERPILINSGYRTRNTNYSIEGAARSSMHLSGKAADISIPDIPTSYLAQLATLMRAGGVGFYPSKGFVHVDCGAVRNWKE